MSSRFSFLILALIHWAGSFFFEKNLYLKPIITDIPTLFTKLIVLICFWQIIGYIIYQYKNNHQYRTYLRYACVYFFFSIIFLILIWPGNWMWDDLLVLWNIHTGNLYVWHHFLTRFFFQIALFIAPTPVSIILLQLLCISLIVGYLIYTLCVTFKHTKLIWLAYIPFLLPPVLVMNNTAYRSTLFAYLILFFINQILFMKWQKRPLKTTETIRLAVAAAIIITLRGEGSVYLIMAPLLFICAFWGTTKTTQKWGFSILTVILAFSINSYQTFLLGERQAAAYQLTTYMDPLGSLVDVAYKNNRTDLITEIDQLLDTQYFIDTLPAAAFFYKPLIRETYYQNDNSKKLFPLYLKLLQHYPKEFLHQRWIRFINSIDADVAHQHIGFSQMDESSAQNFYQALFKNSIFSDYINQPLRQKVLSLFEPKIENFIRNLLTNLLLPMLLLVSIALITLIRKKWTTALTLASVISMYIPVLLFAPDSLFMYYFSFYLIAYTCTFIVIIKILLCIKNKTIKPHAHSLNNAKQ